MQQRTIDEAKTVAEQQAARIAGLERRLGRNTGNSSLSPSSDLFAKPGPDTGTDAAGALRPALRQVTPKGWDDMSVKLIELEPGLSVFAESSLEARFVHKEIFGESCYDIGRLPSRPLVADVGANIGLFSVYVKRRYPGAEILAFEPVPHTADVLRRNIGLHQLEGVTVHEVALGSQPAGDVAFTYFPLAPGSSTRYPEQTGPAKAALGRFYTPRAADLLYRPSSITVRVQTLSDYLTEDRAVDLLKIDAEGAEGLDVLQGISAAHWPLIQLAILEVHDYDGRLAAVCDLLSARGMEPSSAAAPLFEEQVRAFTVRAVRRGSGHPLT